MSGIFTGSLKSGIPKVKTFDGRKYKLEEIYIEEDFAKRMAARIRSQGDRARVVKYPAGRFAVYYNQGI